MDKMDDYLAEEGKSKKIRTLIEELDNGSISIPRFQREFVWSLEKAAALLDSILKHYPAGSLTLWYASRDLRSVRKVGGKTLHQTKKPEGGRFYNYVIDGQQRVLTLWACLKQVPDVSGEDITSDNDEEKSRSKKNEKHDFGKIYVDLSADPKTESVVFVDKEGGKNLISVGELYRMESKGKRDKKLNDSQIDKVDFYKSRLREYSFPISQINAAASGHIVIEVFIRMNTQGEQLGMFEIMVAITYDAKKGFNLADEYKKFQKELKKCHYDKLPKDLVLRVAAMLLKDSYSNKAVYDIKRNEFISNWDLICRSIDSAITLFRGKYGVKYSALLPHSVIITTLFSYFYGKKEECGEKNRELSDQQHEDLEEFFWRAALSDRYASSSDRKLEKDKDKMMEILKGKSPQYESDDWSVDVKLDTITDNDKGFFSLSSHYIKGILSIIYADTSPLNFGDGSEIYENNLSLQQANSKNYHHFFPKDHLKNKGVEHKYVANHVLNITLATQKDNQIYANKAPREYLKDYIRDDVKKLTERLATHLIGDGKGDVLSEWGIKEDNYDAFIEKRASLLIEKIKGKINFTEGLDKE